MRTLHTRCSVCIVECSVYSAQFMRKLSNICNVCILLECTVQSAYNAQHMRTLHTICSVCIVPECQDLVTVSEKVGNRQKPENYFAHLTLPCDNKII